MLSVFQDTDFLVKSKYLIRAVFDPYIKKKLMVKLLFSPPIINDVILKLEKMSNAAAIQGTSAFP